MGRLYHELKLQYQTKEPELWASLKEQMESISSGQGNPVESLREALASLGKGQRWVVNRVRSEAKPFMQVYRTDVGIDYIMADRNRLIDVLDYLMWG